MSSQSHKLRMIQLSELLGHCQPPAPKPDTVKERVAMNCTKDFNHWATLLPIAFKYGITACIIHM